METINGAKRSRTDSSSPLEPDGCVLLITSTEGNIFSNPRKVTAALQKSEIGKPEETRVVRLIIKVKKEYIPAVETCQKLGEYTVKCRVSRSEEENTSYGMI